MAKFRFRQYIQMEPDDPGGGQFWSQQRVLYELLEAGTKVQLEPYVERVVRPAIDSGLAGRMLAESDHKAAFDVAVSISSDENDVNHTDALHLLRRWARWTVKYGDFNQRSMTRTR